MEILEISITELNQDPNNARKHSSGNIDSIKGSLAKFGQQKPIVIDAKNIVIAGNGTLQAAKSLGWETIRAIRTNLEGYDAMAFALADNRTAELAEWDKNILLGQISALEAIDYTFSDIGFSPLDMDSIIEKIESDDSKKENPYADDNEKEDSIPDVPQNVFGVKRGDLWLLGAYLECDSCQIKFDYVADQIDQVCAA